MHKERLMQVPVSVNLHNDRAQDVQNAQKKLVILCIISRKKACNPV